MSPEEILGLLAALQPGGPVPVIESEEHRKGIVLTRALLMFCQGLAEGGGHPMLDQLLGREFRGDDHQAVAQRLRIEARLLEGSLARFDTGKSKGADDDEPTDEPT